MTPNGKEIDRKTGQNNLEIAFDVMKDGQHQACVVNNDPTEVKF